MITRMIIQPYQIEYARLFLSELNAQIVDVDEITREVSVYDTDEIVDIVELLDLTIETVTKITEEHLTDMFFCFCVTEEICK